MTTSRIIIVSKPFVAAGPVSARSDLSPRKKIYYCYDGNTEEYHNSKYRVRGEISRSITSSSYSLVILLLVRRCSGSNKMYISDGCPEADKRKFTIFYYNIIFFRK